MVIKLVEAATYHMNEEGVRRAYHDIGKVGIFYASYNYSHNMKHLLTIREAVLNDYPDMSDEDMIIWTLSHSETDTHAGYTALRVSIPIDDYLRFRKEDAIAVR